VTDVKKTGCGSAREVFVHYTGVLDWKFPTTEIDESPVQFLVLLEKGRTLQHFRLALAKVFSSNPRIVIGPIPPGTGVIAPATFDASA
jgi:hypothetical protein